MVTHSALLARGHAHRTAPQNAPKEFVDNRDKSILVKYDGVKSKDGPRIFAVIYDEDLAKLPESVIKSAKAFTRDPRGNIFENDDAFFVQTADGLNFYVDTDTRGSWVDDVNKAAQQGNMRVYRQTSDIQLMIGPNGDVDPPTIAAYQANGARRIPTLDGVKHLQSMRAELATQKSLEAEDAAPVDPFNIEPEPNDSLTFGR